jgi:hypothetical protein
LRDALQPGCYFRRKALAKDTHQQYKTYESRCINFATDLRNRLIKHLGCSEEKVKWLKFTHEQPEELRQAVGVRQLAHGRRMVLYQDAFYRFEFRIDFDNIYVYLPLAVKKIDDNFIVLLDEEKSIPQHSPTELDQLVQDIICLLDQHLKTEFENFVHGEAPQKPFGYLPLAGK